MATIWNTIKKYATQIGLTYNHAAKTYNQIDVNYNGKLSTRWSQLTKN